MRNKNKIIYIATALNGLESFVHREIQTLCSAGLDVNIFLFQNKNKQDSLAPRKEWNVKEFGVQSALIGFILLVFFRPVSLASLIRFCITRNLYKEFIIVISLYQRYRDTDVDIIYSCFADRKLFVGYLLKHFLGFQDTQLKTSVHAHEIFASPNLEFFSFVIKKINQIFAISEKNKSILVNKFGVKPNNIIVNRLTVDTNFFTPSDKVKVLTVCRFEERKGLYELLAASKELTDLAEFVIVGWGDMNLQSIVDQEQLDNVTIFPKLNKRQLRFLFQNSDIFCLPSKHTDEGGSEGIPVAIMEAMASNLVIVTTKNGSISELVEEIFVDEGDVTSLTEGLRIACAKVSGRNTSEKNRNIVVSLHGEQNRMKIIEHLTR